MVKIPHRLYLNEDEMPKQWYNMRADMKELPAPMMNPATMQPATEEDLYPVFCKDVYKRQARNTGYALVLAGDQPQQFRSLKHRNLVRSRVSILRVIGLDCGCIDHKPGSMHVFFIVSESDGNAFLVQLAGKR